MLIGSVSRPEHLDLFEHGIAEKLDLAYAGPQSVRIAQLVEDGTVSIGAIHTYVELYARMFIDLTPDVALLCADQADRDGNLYTGPNTEDTPTIVEAAAFRDGVVLVQVNEIVDDEDLPRVDIPGGWVDSGRGRRIGRSRSSRCSPATRADRRVEILQAMIAMRGSVRAPQVHLAQPRDRVRHCGDRIDSADLRRAAGPAGQDRQALDAEPASDADPRDRVRLGGVDALLRRRSGDGALHRRPARTSSSPAATDRCGRTGCCASSPASTRSTCSSAHRCRSTARGTPRPSPMGGCPASAARPNMGHDPHGRRHASPAWLSLLHGRGPDAARPQARGADRRRPSSTGGMPTFVERLDAVEVGKDGGMPIPPVMIYGDDVSHVVTEEGVAYLYKAPQPGRPPRGAGGDRRGHADRAAHGRKQTRAAASRRAGRVSRGPRGRRRGWPTAPCWPPAASTTWSLGPDGLYDPPAKFRDW